MFNFEMSASGVSDNSRLALLLTLLGIVPKTQIPTVGSTVRDLFLFGTGPKQRVDILKNLTGRIATQKMTLVMGPPGCGMALLAKSYTLP
jgi:hypothetical protein